MFNQVYIELLEEQNPKEGSSLKETPLEMNTNTVGDLGNVVYDKFKQ